MLIHFLTIRIRGREMLFYVACTSRQTLQMCIRSTNTFTSLKYPYLTRVQHRCGTSLFGHMPKCISTFFIISLLLRYVGTLLGQVKGITR